MPTTTNILQFADVTGDFVYARLQTGADDNPTCYAPRRSANGRAREDVGGRQGAG